MCPMWNHECYGDRCEAWSDNGCRIIYGLMVSGCRVSDIPDKAPVVYGVESSISGGFW